MLASSQTLYVMLAATRKECSKGGRPKVTVLLFWFRPKAR